MYRHDSKCIGTIQNVSIQNNTYRNGLMSCFLLYAGVIKKEGCATRAPPKFHKCSHIFFHPPQFTTQLLVKPCNFQAVISTSKMKVKILLNILV